MRKHAIVFLFFAPLFVIAQVNIGQLGFNYSALVRDTTGRVQVQKPVQLRFTLLLGQNGTNVNSPWIETHSSTTDGFGFVNVTIGKGTKTGGSAVSFDQVDFSLAEYWILIEVKNASSTIFEPLAKQSFQAVPYAKVAGSLLGGSSVPPGTIVAFGGDVNRIPDGWMLCEGRELDNTDPRYMPLFKAIGYNWGTSNGTNKFRIPYTLGMFLRGTSLGSNYDPNAGARTPISPGGNAGDNVGSYQPDEIKSHSHAAKASILNSPPSGNQFITANTSGIDFTVPTNSAGGAESRPKNVNVNYIIKL